MPSFKKWFPSRKHKSTCRGPQPSTSGTATARSTEFSSPKALPNGVGPVKEAEGIVSPVKQKQQIVSSPPPAVSQSSVGTSSATTTRPTYFAPLGDIGRPRTANSNKTSKLCTPWGLETGRPATSHAAATTNSTNHKVEASHVVSKPASAYSNRPQPERSACSPYQASPTILDGSIHPAFRKRPEIGRNAHPVTQGRTEYRNLRKLPGKSQLKPQFGESGQRGAAETSATSTQGQKPDEPSLPPFSQAKRSSPSHVVSYGTSGSPGRDQQPRRCKDDDQRRAANATNAPTQRHEPHEPTPPQLPPRPKTTESSGSRSSSTVPSTIRSSSSRGSTACTEFFDTEGEAAIAFQDIDVPALLSSALGAGRCSFDWNLGERTLHFAKRCMRELERYDRKQSISAVGLLRIGAPSQVTTGANHAEKAWFLLSPDGTSLRVRHITESFCQYFSLFYETLRRNKEIPYQIPVKIRAKINPRYSKVWSVLMNARCPKIDDLANWIDTLEGEKQGISLVALLEISLSTKGLLLSRDLLHSILKLTRQVESLRHVTEDHISNFFATFVCCFKRQLYRIEEDSDHHKGVELILTHSMDYFSGFWSLCTAQYSKHIAGNCLSLFEATIRKLNIIDIPLCLWIFLAGSATQKMKDPVVENMYRAMQSELAVRLPNYPPWILPVIVTVDFLAINHLGFFDIMHHLMLAHCGAELWELGWTACRRLETYRELKRGAEANDRTYYAMAPILMG